MEADFSWLLWALPLVFGLGWLASRLDQHQLKTERRNNPQPYFTGLNHLLNEQQDQAIDAFIEAVQTDPDTSELHFALGNLFRRRGDYERAIRVHQHLLNRADITELDRHRAQYALAQDFIKAGLIDRADEALKNLANTAYEQEALGLRLMNCERIRDWQEAATLAQALDPEIHGSFHHRRSHYLCEQASQAIRQNASDAVQPLLNQAIEVAPNAPRPRWMLAEWLNHCGDHQRAFSELTTLIQSSPSFAPLVAELFAQTAILGQQEAQADQILASAYAADPSIDLIEARATLAEKQGTSTELISGLYIHHLEKFPSLIAATRWMASERLEHEQFHPLVQNAFQRAVKPIVRYRCAACGFESGQFFWQCPGCQSWDSYPPRRIEEL